MNKLKTGELFVLGFSGDSIPSWLKDFSAEFGLGGVILFDYNCKTKRYENNIYNANQVRHLCAQLHALPSRPLIFIDQEGGKVRRLKEKKGFAPLPSAKNFTLLSREEKDKLTESSFAELKKLGIDFNFAPVIDIDYNPKNPDIGAVERSFSPLASEVEENARIQAKAATKHQLGLCLKHFPGLGGAQVNSHLDLTDISDSIHQEQILLFEKLLPQIPGHLILLSHAIVQQWEKNIPVSLSPHAVKMIRSWGQESVLITDDMQMQGLQKIYGTKEACLRAAKAGVDLFCIGNNLINQESDSASYAANLREKSVSDQKLAENISLSIQRVQKLKKRFGG